MSEPASIQGPAEYLSRRTDEQLAELLRFRPDAATPPPHTVAILANRLQLRASVQRALENCDTAELTTCEVLGGLGADSEPTTLALVHARLRGHGAPTKKRVAGILASLRSRGIVWGGDGALRIPGAVVDVLPPGRRFTAPTDPAAADAARAALAGIPDADRKVLETLAAGTHIGHTRDAAPDAPADRPVPRLLAAGLLDRVDDETVSLPPHVAGVLRGEEPAPATRGLLPPAPSSPPLAADTVDAAGAIEAMDIVRHAEAVIESLGDAPASVLKAGGVGVRELTRIAKATGVADSDLPLVLEVLAAARLIACGVPDPEPRFGGDEPMWAPTPEADAWLGSPFPRRWQALVEAWWAMPRRVWDAGTPGPDGRTRAVLGPDLGSPGMPGERRARLAPLVEAAAGTPIPPEELRDLLVWRRPLRVRRLRRRTVLAFADEARRLGVVARDAVTSVGRALAADADPGAAIAAAAPSSVDGFILQADLTVMVPGPPTPELADALADLTDPESGGTASVHRITEATLRRAYDRGWTSARLHEFVTSRSMTPPPQALTYMIDDVARTHGTLRAGPASAYLRCEDPGVLARILASEAADRLLLREIAPTVLVAAVPAGRLVEVLREAGFSPVAEDSDGVVLDLRDERCRVPAPRAVIEPPGGPGDAAPGMLAEIVALMRSGERTLGARGGRSVLTDGSRATGAAAVELLRRAVRSRGLVRIGHVDAGGRASLRLVRPVTVTGGHVDALEPEGGAVLRFSLHRVTSVESVEG